MNKSKKISESRRLLIVISVALLSLAIFAGITIGVGELFYYTWSYTNRGIMYNSETKAAIFVFFLGVGFVFALALFLNMFNF